jgi:hypothetical protein
MLDRAEQSFPVTEVQITSLKPEIQRNIRITKPQSELTDHMVWALMGKLITLPKTRPRVSHVQRHALSSRASVAVTTSSKQQKPSAGATDPERFKIEPLIDTNSCFGWLILESRFLPLERFALVIGRFSSLTWIYFL